MAKRKIERRLVRVQQDAVTGLMERTVLDDAQLATERAVAAVDRATQAVPTHEPAEVRYRIAGLALMALDALEAGAYGSDDPPSVPVWRAIWREWQALDAAGRFRFAEKLRKRLRLMLPHN